MKQNGLPFLLALTCLTFVNASDKPDANWPFLVFRKGETAHLPCIPRGDSNAFFWRKGPWFNISENIASVVHGIPDTSEKYNVLDDGTLVIKDITSEDEGKYYCRIASEKNECRGSVTVYLEARPEEVEVSIEGCTSGCTCVKVLEPSSESQLVCTANMISESMTLKWYNGTKEIMGYLDVPETGQNGKISNVITFKFEEDSILTCKAEGPNMEETTAVTQLRKKEEIVFIENEDTSILLVLTIVFGIASGILFGLLISLALFFRKLKKEQRTTKDKENVETGMVSPEAMKQGHQAEKVLNTDSKETKDTSFSTNKNEPSHSEKDLKEEKKEEKVPLMNESDTSSTTKDKELQKLQKEITKKNDDLKRKEGEVKSLQTELKETKEALGKKTKELITTSNDLKKREDELKTKVFDKKQQTANVQKNSGRERQDIRETTATTENTEKGLQKKLQDTTEKLTTAENANKSLQTELTETKEALEKKNKELITTSNELKKREDELKGLQKKLHDTTKKLTTAENANKSFHKELEDTKEKLTAAENANKNLCAKIAELKKGTVQYLTKTSVRVAIVFKPERFRWVKSKLLELSSKYNTVCAVLGNTPSEDLTVMTESIVESTFESTNSCIVIFGNQGSELVSTLHGDGNVKGLIEGISDQIVSELERRKGDGFKVTLKICNKEAQNTLAQLFNAEGQVVPNKQDRWENHTVYEVKTVEEVTNLTSRMAPNESHLNMQGFIRFIIEIPPSTGQKISRNLTIVSLIGMKHILRFWTATKSTNAFEELLFPVLRNNDTIRFLIGHCHPDQEDGVDETCKVTKQVLDTIIASKNTIAKQS